MTVGEWVAGVMETLEEAVEFKKVRTENLKMNVERIGAKECSEVESLD